MSREPDLNELELLGVELMQIKRCLARACTSDRQQAATATAAAEKCCFGEKNSGERRAQTQVFAPFFFWPLFCGAGFAKRRHESELAEPRQTSSLN